MMAAPVIGAGTTDAGSVDGAAGVEAAAAKPMALTAKNNASRAANAKQRAFGVDMTMGMGKDATTGCIAAGYVRLVVITGP
jgi:hypothetical protein